MEEQLKKEIEALKQELEQTKKDFEYRKHIMQLLQYPIIVLSIIAGLFLAQFGLGVQLDHIAFGDASIKFLEEKNDASRAVTNDLKNEIITLKSQIKILADSQNINSLKKEVNKEVANLAQAETSDYEAVLTKRDDKNNSTYLVNKDGYIWIGNADPKDPVNLLSLSKIKDKDNQLIKDLNSLLNLEVIVGGNMVLRSEAPKNDDGYFKSIERVGVVPRGTKVKILEIPYSIKRNVTQYWAKVKVLE